MPKPIRLLCAAADREKIQAILDALKEKGIRFRESEAAPGRDEVVLAVLSGAFSRDGALPDRLLELLSVGAENVLPLQLEDTELPEAIKNALYSRNIIAAEGRDAALIAERIAAALPQRKSRLPLLLGLTALLLAVAAGLWFWRSRTTVAEESVPVMAGEPAPVEYVLPEGITPEELAAVRCVVIVGEHFKWYSNEERPPFASGGGSWPDMLFEVASSSYDERTDSEQWFWHEDGSQATLTPYDLRFLAAMPNLEELHMAAVEVKEAPDLSELSRLRVLWAYECRIDDLRWIADSGITKAQIRSDVDYSPLGASQTLREAIIDVMSEKGTDLSGFSPSRLEVFILNCRRGAENVDLSGLAKCGHLKMVGINSANVADLSFLAQKDSLRELRLDHLERLRDISAVGELKRLEALEILYCRRLEDYSPIAGCTSLRQIHLQCDENPDAVRDASFLADLPYLTDVGLYSCNLRDMDFLRGLADNAQRISFGFAGDIEDYSGLADVAKFDYLHINPRHRDVSAVLPWVKDASVQNLMLYDCHDVDLTQLPDVRNNLTIRYCDLADLRGLPELSLLRLELYGCQNLRSLAGVEAISTLGIGSLELEIVGCPRLTDFSALDGFTLRCLKLIGTYAVPDLSRFNPHTLRLENTMDLTDLGCLDGLDETRPVNLELVGLDGLRDLTPLRRLHGERLLVPPQVAEQAQELVDSGNFKRYEVAFPDGQWDPADERVSLLSLDELDTLPRALLRRVERLCLVGNTVVDLENGYIEEDWRPGKDKPVLLFCPWGNDNGTPIEYGEGISDLGVLRELTGLRELRLYDQPLTKLDGVQYLSSLDQLGVSCCTRLTDVSAAFACPQLRDLNLDSCPFTSIQGVQNLTALVTLNINNSKVTDLSPLAECDLSAAMAEGGLSLFANNLPVKDYSPLRSVGKFARLDLNDADCSVYVPVLEGVEIREFAACNSFVSKKNIDANALFSQFVQGHPQLEQLWIPWNTGITDLTPLLELESLEIVRVSHDMKKAIQSLEGQTLPFEWEIER